MNPPPNTDIPSGTQTAAPPAPRARSGCLSVAAGLVLVCIGIPMLVCPGPGIAAIAAGLGMIGFGIRRRERDA
jgi:hypothetical protein